jgi:hypothetical protein
MIIKVYQADLIDGVASVKLQNRGLFTHTVISPRRASETGIDWVVGKPNDESHLVVSFLSHTMYVSAIRSLGTTVVH